MKKNMIKIKSNKEHTIPLRKGSKGKSELVAVGTRRRLLKNFGYLRW